MNVIRGNPTPEELAAVVAVVASRAAEPASARAGDGLASVWSDRARNIHRTPHPSAAAWRSSTWPL